MSRQPARTKEAQAEIESDRLGDLPHPRETVELFGQAETERLLRAAFDGPRVHHGWLLTGPEGIGKATLAYRFARYVLGSPAERALAPAGTLALPPRTSVFRQIAALAHPGLLAIRRTSEGKRVSSVIRVEEVRRLRSFLGLTADLDAWRVVIVDTANDLNISAANAILKSLEEPPPRTLFLLVAPEPGRLLPTIRSRCRSIALEPLQAEALLAAARTALDVTDGPSIAAADEDRLAALSQGSVRRLLALAGDGGLALYERLRALFAGLPVLDMQALHALAEEIGAPAAEDAFETFYGLLLEIITRLVRGAARGEAIIMSEAGLLRLAGEGRLALWAGLWERIVRDKAEIMALNLDRKSFVLETGFRMRALAEGRG